MQNNLNWRDIEENELNDMELVNNNILNNSQQSGMQDSYKYFNPKIVYQCPPKLADGLCQAARNDSGTSISDFLKNQATRDSNTSMVMAGEPFQNYQFLRPIIPQQKNYAE